jgi:FAD synthase
MGAVERVVEAVGPHRLRGLVVSGFNRGSKQLGWPTANLDPRAFETRLDAATEGVYVGWAAIGDPTLPAEARAVHKAVLSIGWNPHFDDVKERTIEAYLCHDFDGRDFYDSEMRLLICAFLRPQAKFESFDELIQAISGDVEFGRAALDTESLAALRADAFFAD